MKKVITIIFLLLAVSLIFVACSDNEIINYYLNDVGILFVEYSNGNVEELGPLEYNIANNVYDIHISNGFYVINGIRTKIKAVLPIDYAIDKDGNLIVTYSNNRKENLGQFGNDAINTVKTIEVSDDGFYVVNGIKTSIVAFETFCVTFDSGCLTDIDPQTVKYGATIQKPILSRDGYTLEGWYVDETKWNFNTDTVKKDIQLTAKWVANQYIVSFETGIYQNLDSIYVVYDEEYTLPSLDRIGYTFDGWMYNGRLIDKNVWNIANNCTLIAKWSPKAFNVYINANGGIVESNRQTVLYDCPYDLPVATNPNGGQFIGWFYNGEQITDDSGRGLSFWTYLSDITVTTNWTIELSAESDLQLLNKYRRANFKIMNDITITNGDWCPIGTPTYPFSGQILGGGHSICGLNITQTQANNSYYGFIGCADGSTIHDLSLIDINITFSSIKNNIYIGGLIGYDNNSEISNVNIRGNIKVENHSQTYVSYAGGLVGYSLTDNISNCSNFASIEAKSIAGGIIGYKDATAEKYTFILNKNCGKICANVAGGLIGEGILCMIYQSSNSGNVTALEYGGGLVGSSYYSAQIEECCNSGIVETTLNTGLGQFSGAAGGLIGGILMHSDYIGMESNIENCYNIGSITSNNNAGGILGAYNLGAIYKINIINCYNNGDIYGKTYAGGFGGAIYGFNIIQCANFGKITGDTITAVFAYTLYDSVITDCYYDGSVNQIDYIQGTKTSEKLSSTLYVNKMFWDNEVWNFKEQELPTLNGII